MLKTLNISILFLILTLTLHSQIEFGAKVGLSSYDLAHEGVLIKNAEGILEWNTSNVGYGHHLGAYMRLTLLGLYVEPALLFNSNNVAHRISYYSEQGLVDIIRNEKYNHLNLPVNIGFKLGPLRFHGGAVGHFLINSSSEVFDYKNYNQRLQNATFGWQAGTGVDFWRLRIDLSYEGNLGQFGDEIVIKDQAYQFDKNPGRLILSCGFRIF